MPEFDESREAAQQAAFDAVLMHALNVERNTRGMTADMSAIVEEAGGDLARELGERLENLAPGELSALSRYQPGQRLDRFSTRVQGVINLINEWASTLSDAILEKWQDDAVEFVEQEIEFNQELFASILADSVPFALSARQVYRRAMEEPVMGRFVESALRDESTATRERVYSTIRGGITQGQTNQQIIRALRGTKASNYRDGVLNTTRNNLSSIVRTGRSHLAATTDDEVYRAIGVEEVVFVATIDGRTCLVAGSLIDTPQGKRPIEAIKSGDEVFGGSGRVKRVAATRKAGSRRMCRVKLSNGETVTCTQDHMFWTGRGWVEAKDLMEGENLPNSL